MSTVTARIGLRWPTLGDLAYSAALPLVRRLLRSRDFHSPTGEYAQERVSALRDKLARGETAYVLGIGAGGHNSGVGLVEVSAERGIRLICNHEEERFRGLKHYDRFPELSLEVMGKQMSRLGIDGSQIHAACASWDYASWIANAWKGIVGELPGSLMLFWPAASPDRHLGSVFEAASAPRQLGKFFKTPGGVMPVIGLRHHDNHAWFSWGVSPFAKSREPVMVLVIDGSGDDGAISAYVADGSPSSSLRLLYKNDNIFDSLGLMYSALSSSQGGWPPLSSEGRYMGAAAWGDMNRLTNPYYSQLRDVFVFGGEGRINLNYSLANWQRAGCLKPYSARLQEILGPAITPERMWDPNAVLRVEDVTHAPITRERVDKAAAVQLVFEDAVFHIVQHLIRTTKSTRLVVTGGTALNCLANMLVLEQFDSGWYERNLGMKDARLHLWVPPVPGDMGVPIGAAYHFAALAGAQPGETLQHAFYCGMPPSTSEIEEALQGTSDVQFEPLGNIKDRQTLERVADLMALIVSQDGIIGLYQGAAESGPRALGHRSILANPANPNTIQTLNNLVKFREPIRPLAPMATLEAAKRWFQLDEGASDDHYNAYSYMVLTARARPEAYEAIPSVIHKDGTSRVQIVRESIDPLTHAYLKAMGRMVGAEVSVNTSLNVGAPIAQSPAQAVKTLKKSKGMHGLFMIGEDGAAFVAWHNVSIPPKDAGKKLRSWLAQWKIPSPHFSLSKREVRKW